MPHTMSPVSYDEGFLPFLVHSFVGVSFSNLVLTLPYRALEVLLFIEFVLNLDEISANYVFDSRKKINKE